MRISAIGFGDGVGVGVGRAVGVGLGDGLGVGLALAATAAVGEGVKDVTRAGIASHATNRTASSAARTLIFLG